MHLPCGSSVLASDLPCIYHAARLLSPRIYHAFTMGLASDLLCTCSAFASESDSPCLRPELPCMYHAARRPLPRIYNALTMRSRRAAHTFTMHLPCGSSPSPLTYHAFTMPLAGPRLRFTTLLPCLCPTLAIRLSPLTYHAFTMRLVGPRQ